MSSILLGIASPAQPTWQPRDWRRARRLSPACNNGDPIHAAPEELVVADADIGTPADGFAFGVISILIAIGVAAEGSPVSEPLLHMQCKAIGFRRILGFIDVPHKKRGSGPGR